MDFPSVGSDVYIPTFCGCFIQHPEKDVEGGLAKVVAVDEATSLISLEEVPELKFNWLAIVEDQEELRRKFGDRRAAPNSQSGQ